MHGYLNSWKEIANYLNRGVRTVQRWERTHGLPVSRINQRVTVSCAALDRWWRERNRPKGHECGHLIQQHHALRDELHQKLAEHRAAVVRQQVLLAQLAAHLEQNL